ncbi:MAG: DNA polymerase IV [Clostridia bacterium]|jgi:DNA polymerase-4|nr:DNA polymerase IV [Clostridia bacterium]
MEKVILHCDLNSFYASVECLYNPAIRDKPVAVCGRADLRHGIVLTKNQIAKQYGVITGEAIWQARKKCPQLIIVNPNYPLYLRFAQEAREVYARYTDQIEAFGIDECWLDVTGSTGLFGSGEKMAQEIRERMKKELGVTVSVGVSYNKTFAKLGSDLKKPDAVTIISRENYQQIVWPLPVGELLYVGRSTKRKLENLAITTIGKLAASSPAYLKRILGKWGEVLWTFANGFDETPVSKAGFENAIKGIGNSMTTPRDLQSLQDAKILIYALSDSVAQRLRKHHLKGRTVQIYIRDNTLFSLERQAKLANATYASGPIAEKALTIFQDNYDWQKPIRSLGVRVTDLVTADSCIQLSFFDGQARQLKLEALERSMDEIRRRFGHYAVQRGVLLTDTPLNANPVEENVIHPVSFFR